MLSISFGWLLIHTPFDFLDQKGSIAITSTPYSSINARIRPFGWNLLYIRVGNGPQNIWQVLCMMHCNMKCTVHYTQNNKVWTALLKNDSWSFKKTKQYQSLYLKQTAYYDFQESLLHKLVFMISKHNGISNFRLSIWYHYTYKSYAFVSILHAIDKLQYDII